MGDDELVESLTFDESRERLRHLEQRGLWQVGTNIPGRTFISGYRRPDGYYFLRGGPTTKSGFRTIRRDLPALLVVRSEPAAMLGEAVVALLHELDLSPDVPVKNLRFPILHQMRARSWLDLIKTSASVDVVRLGAVFVVGTWVRDRSRLDGYQVAGKDGFAVLLSPTPHQLGVAIRVAADAAEP